MTFNHTILQVIPSLDAGGAERTTLEMARAIVAAGGKALVATHGGRLAAAIETAGGEIIAMPVHSKNPAVIWLNAGRLARFVRVRGIDLVHARSRAPAWSALIAARRTGAAFVTTYHGAYGEGALKRRYNASMVRGDAVIANSRFTAQAIRRLYQISPEKLHIIPRGADLNEFDPVSVTAERVHHLCTGWGAHLVDSAGENRFRVLLPGRLTKWKGHETAIDALRLMKESGIGVNLALVFAGGAQGSGDYQTRLRAMAKECGVGEMIHMVGDCADMPAAYCWADIVLAPSLRPEAFGRVAVEAGAMGKPVIATNHGGACETIVDRETGFLTEPGNAKDLARVLGDVMAMARTDRAAIGDRARARVSSLYSTATMCDATLNIYKNLLDDAAARC